MGWDLKVTRIWGNLTVHFAMPVETFKLFAAGSDWLRVFFVGKIWPSSTLYGIFGTAMLPMKYSILPVNMEIQLFFVDLLDAFLLVVNSSKSIQTCPKKFFWSIFSPSNQIWVLLLPCRHIKRILPIANCWKYSLIGDIINHIEISNFRSN